MRMHIFGSAAVCCLLMVFGLLVESCSSGSLTRSTASKIISQSTEFTEKIMRLSTRIGAATDWDAHGGWNNPKLKADFSTFNRASLGGDLELKTPAKRVIKEVTGIAQIPGAQGMKEVQFSWAYSPLSKMAKRYAHVEGTGVAVFRIYDNGWRIDRLDLSYSADPPKYSQAELEEIQTEINTETARAKTAKLEAEKKETERLRRVEESKRATREIWSGFTIKGAHRNGKTITPAKLSDVSVTYEHWAIASGPKEHWFGTIKEIDFSPGDSTWAPSVILRFTQYGSDSLYFQSVAEQQSFLSKINAAYSAWWNRYRADVLQGEEP